MEALKTAHRVFALGFQSRHDSENWIQIQTSIDFDWLTVAARFTGKRAMDAIKTLRKMTDWILFCRNLKSPSPRTAITCIRILG